MRKNRGKIAILLVPDLSRSNPFARNEGRCAKIEVKLRFYLCRTCPGATLSHEMKVDRQKLRKNCEFTCAESNPFARNEGRSSKTEEKLRFYLSWSNPFARNDGRSSKTEEKSRFFLCRTCTGATLSHEMKVDRQKLR